MYVCIYIYTQCIVVLLTSSILGDKYVPNGHIGNEKFYQVS